MKKVVKYTMTGICAAAIVVCIIAGYLAGVNSRRLILCKDIRIEVLDSAQNSFVTAADVRKYIERSCGKLIGKQIDSIDLVKVENAIDSRSAVLKSQAFVTRDSILNISVTQRKPVVRFQKKDGGFYADDEGYIFPLQSSYASYVQIIDGDIPLAANSGYKGELTNKNEKEWFRNVMKVVNHIENDKLWKGKIVQISVDKDKGLILIPRKGDEKFIFGNPSSLEEKFNKMKKYYTTIIPEKGEGHYKYIDLRFENQIVCKR